jgi:endoglucanase
MDRREFARASAALALMAGQNRIGLAQRAEPNTGPSRISPVATGTNFSGMEWASWGLRQGLSSAPNLHFTPPRAADIAYLAACGFKKNRLPFQWELLQPMLHDTRANEAARKLIGEPGAFHAAYESFITAVLDAHAAAGITCILDNHNYCRYKDFRYQPDGSILGLTAPPSAIYRPYTVDPSQWLERIFSLAPGATLSQAHFADFWTRAATRWKGHPGLAGYGLMNEPHSMPRPGEIVGSNQKPGRGEEDLAIWPAYARAAIDAIRKVDPATPIYVGGNDWSSAMAMGTKNPGFPLKGDNLIYEVHLYLDSRNTGQAFDYETEAAASSTAGLGRGGIKPTTGVERLKRATDWAKDKKVKISLTEIGMPIDDPRWEAMFTATARHAAQSDCEVFTWCGGSHWPLHNFPINQVPGWHQNKTLEPLVSGALKAASGIAQASLFDDGPGYARVGEALRITLYARGNLAREVAVEVQASGKGTLSKSRLTIPAGANGMDSFTFTPTADQIASLRYSVITPEGQRPLAAPPVRRIFSLADPVAHAAAKLDEAALAILAKYSACKWDMTDAYTDYVQGSPSGPGQVVRAVADSGYGSSPGNAMQMINVLNTESPALGPFAPPLMRVTRGKKNVDHSADDTFGLWCRKRDPTPKIEPQPTNRMLYNLDDAHFVIAAVSLPRANRSGVVFQASKAEATHLSELGFDAGRPAAKWLDSKGKLIRLSSPERALIDTPMVLGFTTGPGAQKLRVDGAEVAASAATLGPGACNQMLIGWGFANYYPQNSFGGHVYAVVTGKGTPSPTEMRVLERYLASLAGSAIPA